MVDVEVQTASGSTRRRWRRRILSLHLYSGILLSPYLILYGVSSLQFNHPADFMTEAREVVEWDRDVGPVQGETESLMAERVRDDLGLFGYVLPWTLTRSETNHLTFEVDRPGRLYRIDADPVTGRVEVVENRGTIWALNRVLHGGGRIPGSSLMTLWWAYTVLSVVVVVFAALSGTYLWFVSKQDRTVGWSMLVTAFVSFFGFLAYLVS